MARERDERRREAATATAVSRIFRGYLKVLRDEMCFFAGFNILPPISLISLRGWGGKATGQKEGSDEGGRVTRLRGKQSFYTGSSPLRTPIKQQLRLSFLSLSFFPSLFLLAFVYLREYNPL